MARSVKVAIAGASGIGKHHAKWHYEAGSEVVGFLGRDEERCKVLHVFCRGQKPPFFTVKHPPRPYKATIQK